jgi:hypothetical protein
MIAITVKTFRFGGGRGKQSGAGGNFEFEESG